MTRFESNAAVKSGYYFNPITMSVAPVARDGERLPNERGSWIAVPTVAALALTPILGALFLMFLPVIGFVLFANAAAAKVVAVSRGGAGELAMTMTPGWRPGEAHLTGKAGEKGEGEKKGTAALEKLEKEIEEKRR